MPDRHAVRKAIDLALQVASYTQLGPAGEELAAGTRRELAELTSTWPEPARASLPATAAAVERERHALDRARNHFIKDFRQRNGMDARRYPPEIKAQLDAGMADFTQKKSRVIEEASERHLAALDASVPPV
jgi:hypothetical protein